MIFEKVSHQSRHRLSKITCHFRKTNTIIYLQVTHNQVLRIKILDGHATV